MEFPMAVDGGTAGIDQSRHHPNAGQSAGAPGASPPQPAPQNVSERIGSALREGEIQTAEDFEFEGLIMPEKEEEFRRLLQQRETRVEACVEARIEARVGAQA